MDFDLAVRIAQKHINKATKAGLLQNAIGKAKREKLLERATVKARGARRPESEASCVTLSEQKPEMPLIMLLRLADYYGLIFVSAITARSQHSNTIIQIIVTRLTLNLSVEAVIGRWVETAL